MARTSVWDTGVGLIDPQGTPFEGGGLSSQAQTTNGVSTHTAIYDFRGPSITLSPTAPGTMSTGGHAPTLVTMIDTSTYGACVFKAPGKPDRTCTLGRGRSSFVRR